MGSKLLAVNANYGADKRETHQSVILACQAHQQCGAIKAVIWAPRDTTGTEQHQILGNVLHHMPKQKGAAFRLNHKPQTKTTRRCWHWRETLKIYGKN